MNENILPRIFLSMKYFLSKNFQTTVCVSRHLKEELAWARHKWLQVISNKMLFETAIPQRN